MDEKNRKGHIAHIVEANNSVIFQTVNEHCRKTAEYAASLLSGVGLTQTGYFIGLIHDLGKCTAAFDNYILSSFRGENTAKGSVNHTFAAVIYILEKWHSDNEKRLASEIAAWVSGSHHGEFDCVNTNSESGFLHRVQKDKDEIFYDEAVSCYLNECASENELETRFNAAAAEINSIVSQIRSNCSSSRYCKDNGDYKRKAMSFITGFLARMLLSALIDADRRDTAEFMLQQEFEFITADKKLWECELNAFEKKISGFAASSPINAVRSYISDSVKAFSERKSGVHTLCVPTGAGKTLASLRYSLSHAAIHGKKRVFFVIPLLSVLEQNAKVIRSFTSDGICAEHHSNVIKSDMNKEEIDRYELIAQTWESPIVITTMVQLLYALFSADKSAIRRLKSLCNSVIVIDEIQTLPKKDTYMFNLAVDFLSDFCGADIVLSSATQPCFSEINYRLALSDDYRMVKLTPEMKAIFKRTEIVDKTAIPMDIPALADFSSELIECNSSLLIICNTKTSAKKLYTELKTLCKGKYKLFHLSTNMCMKHREDVLAEINGCLKNKSEKIVCVSTQLVEAGVDFSFESCIRVMAGMDNAAQAAGRCNRSGDFDHVCKVHIVKLLDERLSFLQDIIASQNSSTELFQYYKCSPESYENDLLSDKSIADFYRLLYKKYTKENELGYIEKDDCLFDMLSSNVKYCKRNDSSDFAMPQAFKTAGELFKVFDENTTDIIVPYNSEAKELIADLNSQRAEYDLAFLKSVVDKLKPYTISVFEYQKKQLLGNEQIYPADKDSRFIALREDAYNLQTGLEDNNFTY